MKTPTMWSGLAVAFAMMFSVEATPAHAFKPMVKNHPRVNEVNRRENRQQRRIANGIKGDKLTAKETAQIEHREARINRTIRRDRAADGGHLTRQDQRQINRMENRESRQIYNDKHN